MRIGLIADTHGYLGADALAALAGCERLLHAGDVGEGVIAPLAGLAPLTAVRGNNDREGEAAALPEIATLSIAGRTICVVHRLVDAPPAEGWDILVFGHCHRRHADEDGARLLINPGAAGRRGFHRERSVAVLDLNEGAASVEFVSLGARAAAR